MSHFYKQIQINEEDESKDIDLINKALKIAENLRLREVQAGRTDGPWKTSFKEIIELKRILKELRRSEKAEQEEEYESSFESGDL